MVSTVSIFANAGVLTPGLLKSWLATLAHHRHSDAIALIEQAANQVIKQHAGELAPDETDRPLSLLQTADILNNLQMDHETLVSAILSELPSCQDYDARGEEKRYGKQIVRMLEQVSEIRDLSAMASRKAEGSGVESLRRMLLGMADDVRVLVIVLAKRLRLMRGLKNLPVDLQQAVSQETRLIHAPLANRLGIWQMKWELEDLSFRYLEPGAYLELTQHLSRRRGEREDFISAVCQRLADECEANEIPADIRGRPKHVYSIWKKMQRKQVDFDHVFDVRAVRVLVHTLPECYEVLGIVHGLWRPVPGEFDDYIARTKANGYQSLHTAVIGDDGMPLEVQVRTHEMHEQSERGVAAHWRYKEDKSVDTELERRVEWMRRWLEEKEEDAESDHEMDDMDSEFEAKNIYVLTPQGKVIELPRGATAVDFAYAIHTSVGHRCRGAKIDGRITTLTQPLESGQRVEVMTIKEGGPSRDWLNPHSHYIATSRARNRIRQWFKHQGHEEHIRLGRLGLDREISRLAIPRPNLEKLARHFNHRGEEELLAAIGRGDLSPVQVANVQVARPEQSATTEILEKVKTRSAQRHKKSAQTGVIIQGVDNLMTHMARCCKPVPYDPIIGYVTQGRGISVHRQDCPVVQKMDQERRSRLLEAHWPSGHADRAFLVDIQVYAEDRKGLLQDITSVFSNEEVDVLGVHTQSDRRHERANMRFTTEVTGLVQLSRILEKLSQVPDVLEVRRQV